MPKVANVYQDKKNKKWYYVASLGYDEHGKRIQHWGRGYSTQKEAKEAYDEYMGNHSKSAVKTNSTMTYQEFYETYFEPDYKRSVAQSTFDNRVSAMRLHFAYFYKRKLKDINAPMLKRWQPPTIHGATSSQTTNRSLTGFYSPYIKISQFSPSHSIFCTSSLISSRFS